MSSLVISFETPPPTRGNPRRPGHEQREERRREHRRERVIQAALNTIDESDEATDDDFVHLDSSREQRRVQRRIDAYNVPNMTILNGHPLFGAILLDYAQFTNSTIRIIVAEMLKQLYNFGIARYRLDTNTQGDELWRPTPDGREFVNEYVLSRLYRNHYMEHAIRILINVSNVEFNTNTNEAVAYIINLCRLDNFQARFPPPPSYFEALLEQTVVPDVMKPLNINVVVRQLRPDNVAMTCGICFDDDIRVNETAVITGCNHVMCSGCITGTAHARGIKTFICCPYCRDEITTLSVPTHLEHDEVVAGLAPVVHPPPEEDEEDNLFSYLA